MTPQEKTRFGIQSRDFDTVPMDRLFPGPDPPVTTNRYATWLLTFFLAAESPTAWVFTLAEPLAEGANADLSTCEGLYPMSHRHRVTAEAEHNCYSYYQVVPITADVLRDPACVIRDESGEKRGDGGQIWPARLGVDAEALTDNDAGESDDQAGDKPDDQAAA